MKRHSWFSYCLFFCVHDTKHILRVCFSTLWMVVHISNILLHFNTVRLVIIHSGLILFCVDSMDLLRLLHTIHKSFDSFDNKCFLIWLEFQDKQLINLLFSNFSSNYLFNLFFFFFFSFCLNVLLTHGLMGLLLRFISIEHHLAFAAAMIVRFITRRFIGEYDPNVEKVYSFNTIMDNESVLFEILDAKSDQLNVSNININIFIVCIPFLTHCVVYFLSYFRWSFHTILF